MDTGPVFADPSGRRRRMLRLVGFGSMGVMAAFLIAVVVAVSGGPQAPLTQWAVPQAPPASGAKQNAHQVVSRPFDHATSTPSPSAAGNPGATAPSTTASPAPSAKGSAKKATPTSSPTPALPGNGRGNRNTTGTGKGNGGNPHFSPSPTPTA